MQKDLLPTRLCFDLFLDAVKRKDKMQFAYFNLYVNMAHCDEVLTNDNVEGEEHTL